MDARSLRPVGAGIGLALLLAGLAAAILFRFDPQRFHFYPVCLFHRVTGLLCPGCGALRALHQLLHGHFLAALQCNALLVLSLPLLAFITGRSVLTKLQGRHPAIAFRAAWLWSAVAVVVIFTVLRNLPFGWALCPGL